MAINKNHEFEELNGVKCGIVEKNVSPERAKFLKELLELNGYTVVVAPSPPPKVAAAPASVAPAASADPNAPAPPPPPAPPPAPPAPETFSVGVTDVTYNTTNAIMGRLLRTKEGYKVTLAYWQQKAAESLDDIPYFKKK
jgi:hypothetical protein